MKATRNIPLDFIDADDTSFVLPIKQKSPPQNRPSLAARTIIVKDPKIQHAPLAPR